MNNKEMATRTYEDIQRRKGIKNKGYLDACSFRYEGKNKNMNRNYKNFGRFK